MREGLPRGWVWAPVGDVGRVQLGRQRSPEHHRGENMRPYLRVANVFEDRIDTRDVMQMNFSPGEFETFRLVAGDILLNEGQSQELVGRPAMFRGEVDDCCFTNSLIRFQTGAAVTQDFMLYNFRHWLRTGDFTAIANITTNIAHLGATRFAEMQIALPPRPEQHRIVAKIDDLLARSRRTREALRAIVPQLERYRQSVLAAAFRGDLTVEWRKANHIFMDASGLAGALRTAHETAGGHKTGNASPPTEGVHDLVIDMFPPGWTLVNLRDAVSPERPITYGILMPGPELTDGVPYIRVADYPNEILDLETIRRTSAKIDSEFKRSRLNSGDLLLSIRGSIGRLVIVPEALAGANITQDTARLSLQAPIERTFVLWYLRSELARSRMKAATKGVAVRGLNIGDVRALQVPLPPVEEQREIVRRLDLALGHIARVRAIVDAQLAQLDTLDRAVLAKAFRGELVPQDPTDEPASVLLERIRADRAAAPEAKRGRGRRIDPTRASAKG